MENYKWRINWYCPVRGDGGTHFSDAETLEEAIKECKQEHMYHRYTGKLTRPDLKIADVWKFVQYGE